MAQTGFRKGHHLRRRSPGDELTLLAAAPAAPPGARGRRPVRPYSYVEPRVLRRHLSPESAAVEIEDSIGSRAPIQSRSAASTTAWYHAEPVGYSGHHRSSVYATAREPLGGRVLSDYRDTATVPRVASAHRYGRWSVYGSAPSSWTRSQSTPPDRYERSSSSQVTRQPLAPRKNREYSIGVKLAESQTDLDSFNRLLEKTFRGGSSYGVYPSAPLYSSDYYDYLVFTVPAYYIILKSNFND